MLIPRPKIQILTGFYLEIPYLGSDGQKFSRGAPKLVAAVKKLYAAWSKKKSWQKVQKISRAGQKISRSGQKISSGTKFLTVAPFFRPCRD